MRKFVSRKTGGKNKYEKNEYEELQNVLLTADIMMR
jgi:hypothetical protein